MGLMDIRAGKWYAKGLFFACVGCGWCCAGPQEGYIWLTRKELQRAADYLKIPSEVFREKYVRRVGFRLSLIEHPRTKDCIFLTDFGGGRRGCAIYPVRPLQCRTWPFWNENLRTPQAWEATGQKCPGINQGTFWSLEQIESQRTAKPDADGCPE
ncbi:MAG TPA: YkgJ family cysteine cluster protein [Anaerohalosphaeraceae bacterium]|nr:YkgJ family cysteine cluster protein [Anaerohalosphaeraceae bacterium]